MVDRGDAVKLETSGNQKGIVQEPDVSLKKRKIGEPYIKPGGASSLTADTPKRSELKEENQSHEATHCLFRARCEICDKAKTVAILAQAIFIRNPCVFDTGLGVLFVVCLCCCRDPGDCLLLVCWCRNPGDCLSLVLVWSLPLLFSKDFRS